MKKIFFLSLFYISLNSAQDVVQPRRLPTTEELNNSLIQKMSKSLIQAFIAAHAKGIPVHIIADFIDPIFNDRKIDAKVRLMIGFELLKNNSVSFIHNLIIDKIYSILHLQTLIQIKFT